MPTRDQLQIKKNPKIKKKDLKYFAKEQAALYRANQVEKRKTNRDKLTPQVESKIINLITRTGLNNADAAVACGITQRTYENWVKWGRIEADRVTEQTEGALKELIEQGKINPNDSEELENFILEFSKALKPNKFFVFFGRLEEAKRKVLAEQLENIKRAGKGGKYLTEKIVHKDKDGNVKRTETKSRYSVPQWGASAWILERLRPDLYSETKRVQSDINMTASVDKTVKVEVKNNKAAEMLEILLKSDCLALAAALEDNVDCVDGEIID